LLAGFILPLVGYFCDRFGRLTELILISSLFNFISNLGWVYIPDACVHDKSCDLIVFFPVALMGISYGIFAGTAWNALCYLVRQD
jgi:MFS family permease